MADKQGERRERPHLFQHARIHEHVIVGARPRDRVEGVLHLGGDQARVDPAAPAEEGQGHDAEAAARQVQAIPGADLRQVEVLVGDVRDVESVLQRRRERGEVLLAASDDVQRMFVDPDGHAAVTARDLRSPQRSVECAEGGNVGAAERARHGLEQTASGMAHAPLAAGRTRFNSASSASHRLRRRACSSSRLARRW